jgi:AraC family transcriptional regulator of adaptative response/methylated-DNA-[protein]-cysteine methyltransferase
MPVMVPLKPLNEPDKILTSIPSENDTEEDCDFEDLPVNASIAPCQFKKRFGMTFVEYARARRMGLAMKQIGAGGAVIDAQLNTGYESSSGFRDAFSKIMGAAPTKFNQHSKILKAS